MLSYLRSMLRCAALASASILGVFAASHAGAQADYGFDTDFNENFVSTFFGTGGGPATSLGSKHAVLPNGDIVVAGRMRLNDDTTLAPFFNIGLARYTRNGTLRTWSGTTGPYFLYDGQYVVYPNLPNGGTGDTRIESVDDIAYAEGRIYVLVTRQFSTSPVDRDAAIVVFNEDGTFHQALSVIQSGIDEYARAIDVQVTSLIAKPISVTVIAQRSAPGPRMVIGKVNSDSNGLLSFDSNFNGGAPLQVPIATSCAGSPQCNVLAGDLKRPFRSFVGDNMPIYAVGSVQRNGTDWDFVAIKLNANGTLEPSFGIGGLRYIAFDDAGSDFGDFAWAIDIESDTGPFASDTLRIAGNVRRSCKDGIGIVALTGDGLDLPGFGNNGRVVHGGSTETGTICAQEPTHFASDIARQGNELGVAGTVETLDQGGSLVSDGALMRVDASSGALRELDALVLFANGEVGSSRLRGILPAGNGRYTVSGEGLASGFIPLYVAARVQPSDRIFADGFEQ